MKIRWDETKQAVALTSENSDDAFKLGQLFTTISNLNDMDLDGGRGHALTLTVPVAYLIAKVVEK